MNYLKNVCYKNTTLEKYCLENDISLNSIKYKLNCYKKMKERYLPIEIQISLAIKSKKKVNKYRNILYKGKYLNEYCKNNNIKYFKIAYRCKYFMKKHNNMALLTNQIIDSFIDSYYIKENIQKLKNVFKKLEGCKSIEYKSICEELNINYEKLKQLKYKCKIDFKSSIYLSWYSSDAINENGIFVSAKKLKQLQKKSNLQINDLYGLYKSGTLINLQDILDYEKNYLLGFIFRVIRNYNFKIYRSDYDDILAEAQIILIKCINNNVLNHIGNIIKYLEKTITSQILSYLINNYSKKSLQYDDKVKNKQKLNESWDY